MRPREDIGLNDWALENGYTTKYTTQELEQFNVQVFYKNGCSVRYTNKGWLVSVPNEKGVYINFLNKAFEYVDKIGV